MELTLARIFAMLSLNHQTAYNVKCIKYLKVLDLTIKWDKNQRGKDILGCDLHNDKDANILMHK